MFENTCWVLLINSRSTGYCVCLFLFLFVLFWGGKLPGGSREVTGRYGILRKHVKRYGNITFQPTCIRDQCNDNILGQHITKHDWLTQGNKSIYTKLLLHCVLVGLDPDNEDSLYCGPTNTIINVLVHNGISIDR